MTRFLPVAGTHGWRGQPTGGWWQWPSPWLSYMHRHGCTPFNRQRPFVWSTQLQGHRIWRRWLGLQDRHLAWECAADNLYAYLVPPVHGGSCSGVHASADETRIVCHSHGLQVVLFAAAMGLRIKTLISVGSPVRADMLGVAEVARPRIGHWLHLHSDTSDTWQVLGGIGDGVFGIVRAHPLADENRAVPHVGHTGVLTDEDAFSLWEINGWLEVLRG